MIERTVTSLEPCKLRGIVRKATSQAPKQRHRLRTGFWQHGALAIELSHGWPAVVERRKQKKSKPSRAGTSETRPLESELLASAFRLDFLYPSLNIDCLRPSRTNPRRELKSGKEKRRKYGTSSDAPVEAHKSKASDRGSQWEPRLVSSTSKKNDRHSSTAVGRLKTNSNDEHLRHALNSHEVPLNAAMRRGPGSDSNRPKTEGNRIDSLDSEALVAPRKGVALNNRALGSDPDQSPFPDEEDGSDAKLQVGESEGLTSGQAAGNRATTHLAGTSGNPSTDSEVTQSALNKGATSPKQLNSLLAGVANDMTGSQHLDVYDLYARLDPKDRTRYRPRVVVYLSRSYNVVAYNRSMSLFRQIDEELWTDELLAAGVRLLLRASQRTMAVNAFKRGAQKKALTGGLDLVLVDLFRSRSWSGVLNVWKMWYDVRVQKGETTRAKEILSKLDVLERRLPGLYFSFEQYLASDRAKELEAGSLISTDQSVDVLRRRFAKMALDRSSPSRAEVILNFYQSRKLYHRYLETMTMKWVRREIDRETAAGLSKVYESYRKQHNFQPSETILHGMFEVYYPAHLQELSRLQDDWCRVHGELSESGFNKYFKLHARLGNVAATQGLVQRYYKKYPSKDREEGALRLMKVYARQGNTAAVQRIQESLPAAHGSHNHSQEVYRTKLLAYVKADQYDEAVACFDSMARLTCLGSSDYAQIMHMCSKHGNLDETLRYFSLAQEDKVEISPGMVAAAVLAFIGNDRLQDAESVAVLMADRGVTSTDIWNELIRANGIMGNMPRCYGLLAAMEKRKIDFSPETYEITLTAMVRYGQVGAAISMLKDPRTLKTFKPSAEHYAVVMAGAVRVKDFNAVQMLAKEMQSLPGNSSFASKVALLAAAVHSGESLKQTRDLALELVNVMQTLQERKMATITSQSPEQAMASLWSNDQAPTSLEIAQAPGFDTSLENLNPAAITKTTKPIGLAVALLVQLRQQFTAEELVSMYLQLQPRKTGEPLPGTLISSLMRAHHNDGDYERVLETWEKFWPRVVEFWVRKEGGLAKPNKQYALVHVLDLVTLSYRAMGDGDGLGKFLMKVYVAGFKMSSNNWNRAIRALAELGDFKVAARWCEVVLMPYWRGWQRLPGHKVNTPERNRFERAIKKAQLDHHFMRPHQETILSLRDQYRKIRTDATWSYDKARLAAALEEDNPRLFRAFALAPLGFEEKAAARVSVGGMALEQHLSRFIETLTASEAKQMNKALARLLQNNKDAITIEDVETLVKQFASVGQSQSTEARSKVIKALALQTDSSGRSSTPRQRETQPTDPVELRRLEARTNEMLEADRAKGDKIIRQRLSNWMARTWKRGKLTRWDDQWAGWGDKTNVPL